MKSERLNANLGNLKRVGDRSLELPDQRDRQKTIDKSCSGKATGQKVNIVAEEKTRQLLCK